MGMMERTIATDECITDRNPKQEAKATDNATNEADPHHFPTKLHRMLVEIDRRDFDKAIVSWQPHGRCFLIKDQTRFEEQIMSAWFRGIKFSSFRRQLHLFGFRKLGRQGPDKGAYYHDLFIRDLPELTRRMKPVPRGTGKRGRKPRSDDSEVDFYKEAGELTSSSPQKGASEATAARKRGDQQKKMSPVKQKVESCSPQRASRSRPSFANDSAGPSFATRPELRHLDSTTGNVTYQHGQGSPVNPMPQSITGLPMPRSLLPPSAEGDLEPLPVQGSLAYANLQSNAYAMQHQRQGLEASRLHHDFDSQQRLLQQQQQQIDKQLQQLQEQRLMLQGMHQPQAGLALQADQMMHQHVSPLTDSVTSPFSQQQYEQLYNQQHHEQLPLYQPNPLPMPQQQQQQQQQLSLQQMQMLQQQQHQQQLDQGDFQQNMYSFPSSQHNPNFHQDYDDGQGP